MSKLPRGWFHRLYDRLTFSVEEAQRCKHLQDELTSVEVDQLFLQMGHTQRLLEAICEEIKEQHSETSRMRTEMEHVDWKLTRIGRLLDESSKYQEVK